MHICIFYVGTLYKLIVNIEEISIEFSVHIDFILSKLKKCIGKNEKEGMKIYVSELSRMTV